MRLSERMMLGSTTMQFHPNWYYNSLSDGRGNPGECGCLLGQAMGRDLFLGMSQDSQRAIIYAYYPWLRKQFSVPEVIRQYSGKSWYVRHAAEYAERDALEIVSALAFLVYEEQITYEQAIDWVIANEPPETPEEKREIVEQFCGQLVSQ